MDIQATLPGQADPAATSPLFLPTIMAPENVHACGGCRRGAEDRSKDKTRTLESGLRLKLP